MTRKYVSTAAETARVELSNGVFLLAVTRTYGYEGEQMSSYNTHDLDGLTGSNIEQLSQLAAVLKVLPEDGALGMDYEELLEFVKEWASETAEDAELPFTFTDREGSTSTYTPASMWEASGGCEWEESAQYGSDYGWDV